jgi:hypothetical protein
MTEAEKTKAIAELEGILGPSHRNREALEKNNWNV